MKKSVIAFIILFLFQSQLLAKDDLTKTLETLKNQGHISAADLERVKLEASKLNDQMTNDKLQIDPFSNVDVSKEGMLKSLSMLRRNETISEEEYEKAKKELSNTSDAQIKSMTNAAIEIIKKDPNKIIDMMNRKSKEMNEDNKKTEIASPRLK